MVANGNGILFTNDKKRGDKHPDYTGNFHLTRDLLKAWVEEFKKPNNAAIDPEKGLKVDLAAWNRSGRKGSFLSVSVSAPYERKKKDDLDDDVPF